MVLLLRLSLAAGAHVRQHSVDAILVDQAHCGVGNAQADEAVLALDPETAVLQVRQEPAPGLVVGVGDVVPHHRAFARHVADACHLKLSMSARHSPRTLAFAPSTGLTSP